MVKGLNNDAAAIKMADNPADLQAVILNEIIIISALFFSFNNLHYCHAA